MALHIPTSSTIMIPSRRFGFLLSSVRQVLMFFPQLREQATLESFAAPDGAKPHT